MTALYLFGAAFCLFMAWLNNAAANAPTGWEDRDGFHRGNPN